MKTKILDLEKFDELRGWTPRDPLHPRVNCSDADFIEAWNSTTNMIDFLKMLNLDYIETNSKWAWKRRKVLADRGIHIPCRNPKRTSRTFKELLDGIERAEEHINDIDAEAYSLTDDIRVLVHRIGEMELEIQNMYEQKKQKKNAISIPEILKNGPKTTEELLSVHPCSRVTLLKRLRELEEDGAIQVVSRRPPSGRGRRLLWSL